MAPRFHYVSDRMATVIAFCSPCRIVTLSLSCFFHLYTRQQHRAHTEADNNTIIMVISNIL